MTLEFSFTNTHTCTRTHARIHTHAQEHFYVEVARKSVVLVRIMGDEKRSVPMVTVVSFDDAEFVAAKHTGTGLGAIFNMGA